MSSHLAVVCCRPSRKKPKREIRRDILLWLIRFSHSATRKVNPRTKPRTKKITEKWSQNLKTPGSLDSNCTRSPPWLSNCLAMCINKFVLFLKSFWLNFPSLVIESFLISEILKTTRREKAKFSSFQKNTPGRQKRTEEVFKTTGGCTKVACYKINLSKSNMKIKFYVW